MGLLSRTQRGWSPAALLGFLVVTALVLNPVGALDDFDDEVTLQEFSSDPIDPIIIARAKGLTPDKAMLGESMLVHDLLDRLGVNATNATTPIPPASEFSIVPPDPRLPGIQTHALASQKTQKMLLSNGMGVNIIYNPDLESSAMAVSMQVGSWSDPDEALGMAHFIEHMLFMGTKQHPKPGNFDDFLSAHGAQISNAMTGSQSTTYAFATPHAAFAEGVERFSEFFTNPLFDSAGAEKEMHAVNQEFEMHKDQDMYREYHVEKELSNPAHPCQRFTIGNLDTLANVTHDSLITWYENHYSANLMHIAVYTAEPLDKVAQLIADKFSAVKNKQYKRQNVGAVPTLDPKLAGHVVHVKPLTEIRRLNLKWELPAEYAHMRESDPGRIAGAVLGDEGPHSLLAHLKKHHLALGLSAGLEKSGADNALFGISVALTEAGMLRWREVVALCFRAVSKFGSTDIPEYLFDEAVTKDENSWKFQWRTSDVFDAAMGDAQAMIEEPLESYPTEQSILQTFDPASVTRIFKLLLPNQTHITVMGDDFDWSQKDTVRTEKYYKVTYAVTPVGAEDMTSWQTEYDGKQAVGPTFSLAPQNDKLPKDLSVSEINPDAPRFPDLPEPVLVANESFGTLYLKTDDVFGDPYISSSFEISTDAQLMEGTVEEQAKATMMASLWVSCVVESLSTDLYAYSTASLGSSLSLGKGTNLWLSVSGMNTKQDVWDGLLNLILERMTQDLSLHTTEEDFNVLYQATSHGLKNGLKSGPSAQASRHLWSALSNTRLPIEEQMKALNGTTYQEVVSFGNKLLNKVRVKGFFYGQLPGERALKMWNTIKSKLTASGGLEGSTLPEGSEFVSKFRVLPENQGPFYKTVQGDARGNSTVLVIDGGVLDCQDKVAVELLYKNVRQMFFNELRTKQQTGYVAQTSVLTAARRTLAMFVVVSSWAGPGDLLSRYLKFIDGMLAGLNDGSTLSEETFGTIKSSLLSEFSKPIANIAGMSGILEDVVKNYDGDFQTFKKRQTIIRGMTIDRIKAAATKMFSATNKRRLAVLYSPENVSAGPVPAGYQVFNNAGEFQKRPGYQCSVCVDVKCANQTSAPQVEEVKDEEQELQEMIQADDTVLADDDLSWLAR